MTQVNITEFRNNIKKYCKLVQKTDIEVINRNEVMFVMKSTKSNKKEALNAILGAAPFDGDYKEILKGRIKEI